MKNWIKKLSDSEIEAALKNNVNKAPIPDDLDNKELYKFQHYSPPRQKRQIPVPVRMVFAFAAAFIVLIILGINFMVINHKQNSEDSTPLRVSFLRENANLYRNNVLLNLGFNDNIKEGDRIKTSKISALDITLGKDSTVSLHESSQCILTKISEKETTIDLLQGKVLADINHLAADSQFVIRAHDIKVSVVGTQFMVERTTDGATYIYVYRGTVKVDHSKQETVSEGNFLKITGETSTKDTLTEEVKSVFKRHQKKDLADSSSPAIIKLSVKPESARLTLDDDDLFTIYSKAEFPIDPGKHVFELHKEGYRSVSFSIDAHSGEKYTREIILQEDSAQMTPIINKDKIHVNRQWEKIYSYQNQDNSENNSILGFTSSGERAVAYTQTALIGIQSNGVISWKKTYGKEEKILFNSLPFISNEKVYISSSNQQLLVLDNKTGKELQRISTNGSINFNYSMMKLDKKLYIPYADGLYTYDLLNKTISTSPIIPYNSPTIPIIDTGKIYLSSFLLKEIVCIDAKTNSTQWKYLLDERGYSPLFKAGNNIAIGDKSGNIYLFSTTGQLLKKRALPAGITSRLVGNKSTILCLADDGILYKINIPDLSIEASFPVDSKAHIPTYIYKHPVIQQNKAFIGTDKGDIMLIDLSRNSIEDRFNISNSAISSAISSFTESYIAGTENGEIFFIKYK